MTIKEVNEKDEIHNKNYHSKNEYEIHQKPAFPIDLKLVDNEKLVNEIYESIKDK